MTSHLSAPVSPACGDSHGSAAISVAVRNTGSQPCLIASRLPVAVLDDAANLLVVSETPDDGGRAREIAPGQAVPGIVDWIGWCTRGTAPTALALLPPGTRGWEGVRTELPATFDPPGCRFEGPNELAPFVLLEEFLGTRGFHSLDDAFLSDDRRTLTVHFNADDPCPDEYKVSVRADGDLLAVAVFDDPVGPPPGDFAPSVPCPTDRDYAQELEIELATPFAGSRVRDPYARVHFVARPGD